MDSTLRGVINYPQVMQEYERQGHGWGKRWAAAFPAGGWKALLQVAYQNFSDSDEVKFSNWLDGRRLGGALNLPRV